MHHSRAAIVAFGSREPLALALGHAADGTSRRRDLLVMDRTKTRRTCCGFFFAAALSSKA
jgi:hypothetical protein